MRSNKTVFTLFLLLMTAFLSLVLLAGCSKKDNLMDEQKNSTNESTTNSSDSSDMKMKENNMENSDTDKDRADNSDNKDAGENLDSTVKETDLDAYEIRNKKNFLVCIDPGHGDNSFEIMENIAPNSSEQKPGFAFGTTGVATGTPERDLNLEVSKKLNEALKAEGYQTAMTREVRESDMTNIGRAEFGNELNADLVIRIHANGSESQSTRGAMVLVPSGKYISDQKVLNNSRAAGQNVLDAYINTTGATSLGLIERDDMTGFNWSKVPVILMEMGFMTNPEEDLLMATPEYQEKMVKGMVDGINNYHFLMTK